MNELFHFEADQLKNVVIHKVGFGERNNAMLDAEHTADFEMFPRLRLDRFVGRDDEQQEIDAAGAGEHVFDEALMSGYIYESEAQIRRDFKVRETKVDGNAAAFLFFETVGFNPGESAHECALAMIDVSGGAHNDV